MYSNSKILAKILPVDLRESIQVCVFGMKLKLTIYIVFFLLISNLDICKAKLSWETSEKLCATLPLVNSNTDKLMLLTRSISSIGVS